MSKHTTTTESTHETQSETVLACPDCDSTGIRSTVRDTTEHEYACRHCGAAFDDPIERERYGSSGRPGLAGRLAKLDPDAVGDDQLVTDGGLDVDIEDIGVAKGEGESWSEVADRLRSRDDDRWHYCVCGARYRSRGAALLCCGERFADEELVTDGGRPLGRIGRQTGIKSAGGGSPISVSHVQEGNQSYRYRRDESVQQNRDCRSLPEDDDRHSKAEERRHEEDEGVQAALEGIRHMWAIGRFADKPDVIRSVACFGGFVTEQDGKEIVTDGGTPTDTETEHYADGSFVICPDCGGDLTYQNPEVVLCTDCDAEFSHFYHADGTNELFRAPDMERVTTVYDPDDDQRDDEESVTDGGSDERSIARYRIGGPHPSVSYGPAGDGEEWVLAVTTESEGRVEIVLDERRMYELWTEVHNVPWPEASHHTEERSRLVRQVVHAANGADEAMLRDALEALGVRR